MKPSNPHVTAEQVRRLLAAGRSWEEAARELRIRPGLAFLIETGIPADGSGTPELEGRTGPGPTLTSPQSLVNSRAHNPVRNEQVDAWVRGRASRELNA